MPVAQQYFSISLVALLASSMVVTTAWSETPESERDRAIGYVTDSDGTIVRDISGECVRSSSWTPEKAVVVGCDGVVLHAPTQVTRGKGTGHNAVFVIPSAKTFAFDSAELTPEGKQQMEEYRAKIQPELAQAYAAVIVGHTDSTGDLNHNLGLSERRAAAVRDYLISTGAPAQKIRIVGMGPKEPIAANDTKDGRAQNRRVEVIVFGEARGLDVMEFPSVAMFPRRGSDLTIRGKQMLKDKEQQARQNLARAVYIEVIGHTDDVGNKKDNQKLSEARANAVRDDLIASGVDPSKIRAVGVGASQPIASNQTEEGRANNRRVEVVVLGRLKQ